MPSVSDKQKRFMKFAAASPANAKKAEIPQKVAKEFALADARVMPKAVKGKKGRKGY